MKPILVSCALALAIFAGVPLAHAETCPSKDSGKTAEAQQPPKQKTEEKGQPSSVGKDGVAGTGWTGGAGGLSAGIETQKGDTRSPGHSEEAKGLDLKKDTAPTKC